MLENTIRARVLQDTMRKLARECVIFMLLAPPILFSGKFAHSYRQAHRVPPVSQYTDNLGTSQSMVEVLPPPPPTSELVGESLVFGVFLGFPAGLMLWIFYRMVRFALKG